MTLFLLAISLLVPFAAKLIRPHRITWTEMGLHMAVVAVMVSVGMHLGKYTDTQDFEIWNGAITDKSRVHNSYVRTYQCNCQTVCSGSGENRSCRTVCQTCRENRYTVTWRVDSTIGRFVVDHVDRGSRSVYRLPDPAQYAGASPGDPVSREMPYTNYIRGVRSSLFSSANSDWSYLADYVPAYPRVTNRWEFNRVLASGVEGDFGILQERLALALREMGARKEVNIVVIIAGTGDRNLRHAVEAAWHGGKKNDVVVLIGAPDGESIVWADVITLAGNFNNSQLDVSLRRDLTELGSIRDQSALADVILRNVDAHFERVSMAEFEYLKAELEPPLWVIILLMVLTTLISVGLVLLFDRSDISIGNLWKRHCQRRNRRWH